MIQRQQSLWLLLSTLGAFLSFELPFFSGAQLANNSGKAAFLTAGSTFFLMALTGASILLSVITLFLYKDRKLQLKLCLTGIGLSILILVLYFVEMKKISGSISLWAIFVFAIPIGFIMAARGIHRDEKLVKSLDKLR
jgi:Domain of unknown function (DUF4293)